MKTIQIKGRIQNFKGTTYKPGTYEITEGQPVGWQVTEETAEKLLTIYPALVTPLRVLPGVAGEGKKAGK